MERDETRRLGTEQAARAACHLYPALSAVVAALHLPRFVALFGSLSFQCAFITLNGPRLECPVIFVFVSGFLFSERPRPYFVFFSTFHVLRFPFGVAIRTLETQVQPRELKCARLLRRTRGGGGGDVCVQSAAVSFVRCGLFCPRCGRPCT